MKVAVHRRFPQATVELAGCGSVIWPDSRSEWIVEGAGLQQMFCWLTASTSRALLCMAEYRWWLRWLWPVLSWITVTSPWVLEPPLVLLGLEDGFHVSLAGRPVHLLFCCTLLCQRVSSLMARHIEVEGNPLQGDCMASAEGGKSTKQVVLVSVPIWLKDLLDGQGGQHCDKHECWLQCGLLLSSGLLLQLFSLRIIGQ